ncbi:sigma-70 family RNA polymerase sigma factor [Pseudomonas putida]|uniref:Sigma-70 family RNA polymerase sigma factor n=1 Tax=Pseudomonas putida TaxID=303 RepID=A0A4D6XGC3_PSEPU|nr:sigma-70 family RNA polymerase sigma factor [Pseudomonas putida]QCI14554.1 sigma-70 family RNA polymerase sigma factor [Pseudomonas putida]
MPASSPPSPQDTVGTLYRDHSDWLHQWLRKRMACSETAADLAHDTFVRLLSTRRVFDLRQPRAYLSSVARSILIDSYRRRSIERAYLETLANLPEALEVSPETRLLILETLVEIDAMLDGLGARTRSVFLLSQLEGLSYVEIARRLSLSVTTVKKHATRALTHVLLHLEG